ncbi:unnamed protein product [Sphagnum tenellum]
MDTLAEGLWGLAEGFEKTGCIAQAIKCLEAICQSHVSFLPIVEVKTRLRIATLLLQHTDNITQAKTHLERAQLLLKQIPACFELKCRAYSLLSRCYLLVGTISSVKQTLRKGIELSSSAGTGEARLWACNFNLQLAKALTTENDHVGAVRALDTGLRLAASIHQPPLQMVFSTARVHVQLMQWEEPTVIEQGLSQCDTFFDAIPQHLRRLYLGLHVYKELLHTFYLLRACEYKEAQAHVAALDAALSEGEQEVRQEEPLNTSQQPDSAAQIQELQHQLEWLRNELQLPGVPQQRASDLHYHYGIVQQKLVHLQQQSRVKAEELDRLGALNKADKLPLGPAPLDEEWLPKAAVMILVDLMVVICSRPKGMFKDCSIRINAGIDQTIKLWVGWKLAEAELQHWAIGTGNVYLLLLLQLLENKVIINLTCSEFVEGQESLVQIVDWHERFPRMLQGSQSNVQLLLGHYSHSVGCFHEAALHFLEGAKLTESEGLKAMCNMNAAVSFICIGDSDSSSQALDLIAPVYRMMDSYVGVREKTLVLFASGLHQTKQHNLQEARSRLATGLKLTHTQLGNHQLVSQYLTVLGSLALAMHDTTQARDILKSSFTLAKALHDIPTQVGVLAELMALYREVGEASKETEHSEAISKKVKDLKRRIEEAEAASSHHQLLQFGLYKR